MRFGKKKLIKFNSSGQIVRENGFTLRLGICVPASCSVAKTAEFMNDFLLDSADLEAFNGRCQTNDPLPLNGLDIFAMLVRNFNIKFFLN